MRLTALLCISLCACDDVAEETPVEVTRPTDVASEARPVEAIALPGATSVAATTDGLTLIGTDRGLFSLAPDGTVTELDATPVVALAPLVDGGALVAHATGLQVYDGDTLEPSALELPTATALTPRGDTVWIATPDEVWALGDATLERFPIADVQSITASAGAPLVVLDRVALDPTDGWRQLDLDAEPATALTPGTDGLYGLVDGVFSQRVATADDATWRPVALGEDDAGEGALALATDPTSAAVWVLTADTLVRVEGDRRTRLDLDAPATTLTVDTVGTVWLFAAGTVTRLPTEALPDAPNWADDIALFAAANCVRCHGDLGTAPPMHTYEHWVDRAERIVARLELGDMPADRQPLEAGDLDLVRAWRNGGFQR